MPSSRYPTTLGRANCPKSVQLLSYIISLNLEVLDLVGLWGAQQIPLSQSRAWLRWIHLIKAAKYNLMRCFWSCLLLVRHISHQIFLQIPLSNYPWNFLQPGCKHELLDQEIKRLWPSCSRYESRCVSYIYPNPPKLVPVRTHTNRDAKNWKEHFQYNCLNT